MLRLCASEQRLPQDNRQRQQRFKDNSISLRWISGLLISGDGSLMKSDQQLLRHLADELPDPAGMDDQLFFEKLVTEFPSPWRRTLLKLALLDRIPLPLAQKLSEITDIAAVFDYFYRYELSVTRIIDGEEYQLFKPQTRDLLRRKAEQSLDIDERRQVYLAAADWYRQQKDFSSVLGYLIYAQQYSAVSQLLSQVGLTLLDSNYRSRMFPLIDRIPEDVAATCGWMALFRGINWLQEQSTETDVWLELAYQRFQAAGDARGALLALTQQVCQAVFLDGSFERCLKRLDSFRTLAADQLAVVEPVERLKISYALGLAELFFAGDLAAVDVIMTKALAEAQHLQLLEQQQELNLLRALYALQQGSNLVARTALEQGLSLGIEWGESAVNNILQVVACTLLHASGDLDGFRQQQQNLASCCGRNVQQRTVFAALLGYYAASLYLARGERQTALEIIEVALLDGQAAKNSHLQSRLLQLRGLVRALFGQEAEALIDLEAGLQLRRQAGGDLCRLENLLFAGITCFALQRFDQAAEYFAAGLTESFRHKEERFRAGLHAWTALVRQLQGDLEGVVEHAREFLEMLRRHRINFFWGLLPELLEGLIPVLNRSNERLLLQTLLEEHLGRTLNESNQLIPLLSIHCLGGFQLQLKREVFDLNQVGQASRQIFALLVVAPKRTLSIELMMGLLWPESSSSKARSSFDTAHSRLRKALEGCFGKRIRREYLVLEKGMLSLRHVRIDSALFTEAMERARYHLRRENFWQAEHVLWKMERLWDGEFLSGYDLDGDFPLQRDQLTQLHLEQLGLLAQLLQRRHQGGEAIRLLQTGLSLDPTQDSLIRQLLLLYRKQQDNYSATLLLKNYRTALQAEEYESDEIEELIEVLGVQWPALCPQIQVG